MSRWYIAVLIYLIVVSLLLAFRPKMLFLENKDYRTWGMNPDADQSIFSVMFLFPIIAFVSYYLAALIFMLMV
jgi:hypothetical protein